MEKAKKSHKKLWITLTAIVVVLAILVFMVLGMLRGFGPGHALYNIHPTKAGYREWWCPEMEKQLLAYYDSLEK